MKQTIKEITFTEYKIIIKKVYDRKKIEAGQWENIDKMYLIDIKNSYGGGIGFAVKYGENWGKNLRKVFKRIQEELHLI